MKLKLSPYTKSVLLLLILATSLISTSAGAQEYKYDIIKGGKSIGSMKVLKITSGDTVQYEITSETTFKLLFTLKVDYAMRETYIGGNLVKGDALSTLSGRVQNKSEVIKKGNYYEVETISDRVKIPRSEIKYSIPEIYFSEPESSTEIFSQVFATYLPFEKIEDHVFTLTSEDGKNTYIYEDGICQEVRVIRSYANFSFRLVDR